MRNRCVGLKSFHVHIHVISLVHLVPVLVLVHELLLVVSLPLLLHLVMIVVMIVIVIVIVIDVMIGIVPHDDGIIDDLIVHEGQGQHHNYKQRYVR